MAHTRSSKIPKTRPRSRPSTQLNEHFSQRRATAAATPPTRAAARPALAGMLEPAALGLLDDVGLADPDAEPAPPLPLKPLVEPALPLAEPLAPGAVVTLSSQVAFL